MRWMVGGSKNQLVPASPVRIQESLSLLLLDLARRETLEDQLSAGVRGVIQIVESDDPTWSEGLDLAEVASQVSNEGGAAENEHLP